jgi:hypothetical protein
MELVLCPQSAINAARRHVQSDFLLGYEITSGINKTQKAIGFELELWLIPRKFHYVVGNEYKDK